MAVLVHAGHPRQGKSYSAVCHQIIPALVAGRRVVTNIEGMGSAERNAKMWARVEELGGAVDPDLFKFVKHSELEGGLIFPRDTKKETADGIRIFDDSQCYLKFGDLLIWDEARIFKTGKLPDIFADALDYHGHWARNGFSTDLLLLTPGWDALAPTIRRLAEIVYIFDKHAGGKAFTRYFYKTPGNIEIKPPGGSLDRETFKFDPVVQEMYATNMDPDSVAKDTIVVPLWKQARFMRAMGAALGVILLCFFGMWLLYKAFWGDTYGEADAAQKVADGGTVRPGAKPGAPAGGAFGSLGSSGASVDTTPTVVGLVPAADGGTVALVRVGERYENVRVRQNLIMFNGEALPWPDGF